MVVLLSKIKSLLHNNQLIGKIDSPVPHILSTTIELFLVDLISSSLSVIKKLEKKKLATKHIKYVLRKKVRFKDSIEKKN